MLSSIFKNLFGKTNKPALNTSAEVDLARAIPGYTSPFPGDGIEPTSVDVEKSDEHLLDQEYVADTELADLPPEAEELDLSEDLTLDPEDRAEAAVEALAHKHSAWANSDLSNLQDAWAEVKDLEDLQGHLDDLGRVSHNLKGMAATYGYPAISRIASSLCTLLNSGEANNQHALINLHVEACRAAHLQAADPAANEQIAQSVCVALETQVKRTLSV